MNLVKLQADPATFRNFLRIDTGRGFRDFRTCAEPWQIADLEAMDPAWRLAVLGRGLDPPYTRAYLGRPRGHSKSTDLAIQATWAVFAAQRPLRGVAAAADQDQARLLRDAIDSLVRGNEWLRDFIDVQKNAIVNPHTGAKLDILASDAPSSYGLTPDFIICDELTHWPKRDMWDSLISSAAKRPNCVVICITNAGIQDSWQSELRRTVSTPNSGRWYYHELAGPVASWITPASLDEQRSLLPLPAYERLWLNQWTGGGGDALTRPVIDAAFKPHLGPMTGKELGYQFVAGFDLGLKRDSSALVVLATHPRSAGPIRLAYTQSWRPNESAGGKVDLMAVERAIVSVDQQFNLTAIAFDPWQAELMAQRLEQATQRMRDSPYAQFYGQRDKHWLREKPATAENLREQASLTIECFNDRRVHLYDCQELRRDLIKLRVVEKSYGYRLTSPRDVTGHGDMFSAFALALPIAHKLGSLSTHYYRSFS